MYKIIHGLSSPPLGQLVRIRTTDYRSTRGALSLDEVSLVSLLFLSKLHKNGILFRQL